MLRRIGRELASQPRFLMQRAGEELNVTTPAGRWSEKLASMYVRLFGVPEIGVYVRINEVLDRLPRDVGRVVDLGCGPGMLLGAVHSSHRYRELVGIEIDPAAAEIARETHRYARILVGDVCRDDFSAIGEFDYAISIDVLEHLAEDEIARFIDQAHRLLRSGGSFIVHVPAINQRRHFRRFQDWAHHDHEREGFTGPNLAQLLSDGGFNVVETHGTFGWYGALAWETNMLFAGKPIQALAYPPLMLLAQGDAMVKSARYNGVLVVAQKSK